MKAVLQRVSRASVTIEGEISAKIDDGLLILLGIEDADSHDDIEWLCRKIINMRIFGDQNGAMNISLKDIDGDAIVVSQFTLHASTKKGNRPSFIRAAKPDFAKPMYEKFIDQFQKELGKKIGTGEFGADMKVDLLNDGPVTILIDSKEKS